MSAKIEIDASVLKSNAQHITKSHRLIYVAKANAYGVGEQFILPYIDKLVDGYAVSSEIEAENLSKYTDKNILILLPIRDYEKIEKLNVSVTVSTLKEANIAKERNLSAHIKVNSGMNRFGVDTQSEAEQIAKVLGGNLTNAFTHFCCGESDFCAQQIEKFEKITKNLNLPKHVTLNDFSLKLPREYALRGGIDVLGLRFHNENLSSAIAVKSQIVGIRELEENENLGYNFGYTAKERTKVGIVGLGYGDIAMRRQSNCGKVLVNGRFCDIIGYICMDVLFCKLNFDGTKVGDEVVIIDNKFDELSWNEVAKRCQTIPYELITSISERVERTVINDFKE